MGHRKAVLLVAAFLAVAAIGCSKKKDDGGGPTEVEFGLDVRPANATCLAPARPPSAFNVQLQVAFGGITFDQPVLLLPHPSLTSPQRWYVVDLGGTIRTFEEGDGQVDISTAFTRTVTNSPLDTGDERGLLGFALHPDFGLNGRAFVHYQDGNLTSRLHEITTADGGLTFTAAASPILSLADPYGNHNGGMIDFGPDGFLYVGIGDGGSFDDPDENGQDTTVLFGKILRIDVDSGSPYGIPADNPFAGSSVDAEEIYAWGFRNPWRFSFDQETGELWVGDVGQDAWEEIDKVELGGNYGWDDREGNHCFEEPGIECVGEGKIAPVVEHAQPSYVSITGGYVYRGTAIPELVGHYIYGDYGTGLMHTVFDDEVTGLPEARPVLSAGFNISSFGQGLDGEVYVISYSGGADEIYKIVPTGGPVTNTFPDLLSETGCFDAADPRIVVPGLIPYEVNAPLWSDGADKRRWMALPDGETIDVDPVTGDWTFPLETVLVKEFSVDDQRIETRLLVLHTDGNWAGYSYEWDENETEATLLPAGKTRAVGTLTWGYPSRGECLQCHTDAAGRSLGLETVQMNRDAIYPGDLLADQMNTLEHIGMFTATPARLEPLPAFDGNASGELRARSYLHANCANCHQPGGTGQGPADFLFTTALADMGICDVAPENGNMGLPGAVLLAPGDPDLSLMSLRMHTLDSFRMPDIGTRVVDPQGTSLVDAWITGLAACP